MLFDQYVKIKLLYLFSFDNFGNIPILLQLHFLEWSESSISKVD